MALQLAVRKNPGEVGGGAVVEGTFRGINVWTSLCCDVNL